VQSGEIEVYFDNGEVTIGKDSLMSSASMALEVEQSIQQVRMIKRSGVHDIGNDWLGLAKGRLCTRKSSIYLTDGSLRGGPFATRAAGSRDLDAIR